MTVGMTMRSRAGATTASTMLRQKAHHSGFGHRKVYFKPITPYYTGRGLREHKQVTFTNLRYHMRASGAL